MADKPQVVKLAQPGFDVKTAGDENLIYNSNWPLLKIYKQGSYSTQDTTTPNKLVTALDLGYVPAFWFFSNNDIQVWQNGISAAPAATLSEFNGILTWAPVISPSGLWFSTEPGVTANDTFYYYIFALDLNTAYQAPSFKAGGLGGHPGSTVFKLAKDGKEITSKRLEDYTIHSDARSPLIHAVVPATTMAGNFLGGFGFTFYHNLGYIPMFFAYLRVDTDPLNSTSTPVSNSWTLITVAGGNSGFTVDEQKITFAHFASQQISLVILKDPFIVDNSVAVTI